jgi:hypothetical protein
MRRFILLPFTSIFIVSLAMAQWVCNDLFIHLPSDTVVVRNLVFGTTGSATDAFNSGIDLAHPPCAPSGPCVYFAITDPLIDRLTEDYRSSSSDEITWTIVITGTMNPGFAKWNPTSLPSYPYCSLFVKAHYPPYPPSDFTGALDMRRSDSIYIAPAQILSIRFTSFDQDEEKIVSTTDLGILDISPNPFNSTSEITYSLVNDGNITLDITDIYGKHVQTIKKGFSAKGMYSSTWNGTDSYGQSVSSGIYFVRLCTENDIKTRKIILVR